MRFASALGIALLLLLSSELFYAQTADELGLVLTGETEKPFWFDVNDDQAEVYFLFRMTFENKGHQPVILINPTLNYGTGLKEARLSYVGLQLPTKPEVDSSTVKTFEPTAKAQFRAMTELFDDTKPPENYTISLRPGDRYTFVQRFHMEAPRPTKDLKEGAKYYKNWGLDLKDLQLTYEFSFLPYVKDPDFLETLNVRWRRYGQLPIGPGGTYTVTSEKIKLPN